MLVEINLSDPLDSSYDYGIGEFRSTSSISKETDSLSKAKEDNENFCFRGTEYVWKDQLSTRISKKSAEYELTIFSFAAELFRLSNLGDNRSAMYVVHKQFISWKREKDLTSCDLFFKNVDVRDLDIRILISLLMASFQLKSRLSYRTHFYEKVLKKASLEFSQKELIQIFSNLR